MSLREQVGNYLPFLAPKKGQLTRTDSLKLKPVRNPVVRWEDGHQLMDSNEIGSEGNDPQGTVVLIVPRREDLFARIVTSIFKVEGEKRIELDELGSEIWSMCDGNITVDQMVLAAATRYKLNHRQAEVSVVTYMRMLSQRRLIGFKNQERSTSHVRAKSGHKRSKSPRARTKRTK